MKKIVGTYECKSDTKGRISLPTSLKGHLNDVLKDSFIIKRSVFQPCLELYHIKEWDILMEKMNTINRFKKKHNDFIRLFTAGVQTVNIDASGRLLIPKKLFEFAGIQREVVLSSVINIIEVWDKSKYENAINNTTEGFADLAEEVMGNSDYELS